MFIAMFIARKQKQPNCLSAGEQINPMFYIHIMESYLSIKKNETLLHVMTCMNLKNIVICEKDSFTRLCTV